ncbi:MAG TPA: hypothetical protein VGP28_09390 [Methylocella sp.]|jgi:flagellar biosynthesis GTPase FlhF|nr:hypothetical protein [Methylocella sp.]
MGEGQTEREALLQARVKELEAAAALRENRAVTGGIFEQAWLFLGALVPPWLTAVALAVFIAHYGFGYYLQGQVTAAETQLKQAKADLEIAKAEAANAPDAEGVPMRLATMKAQMDKTTAEAAIARASANALKAQVNGETAALQNAKAQLDYLQNQARLAQAKADAESAHFGPPTLEDRAQKAKVMLQKLKAIAQNREALMMDAINRGANPTGGALWQVMIRAECENNDYAELIGCPSQFLQQNRRRGETPQQENNPQVASVPSEDNGQFWKVSNSCTPEWRYFQDKAAHGAFAVTKSIKGGCGWSWSPTRPIETMRLQALAACSKYGSDCKIIGEK